MASGRRGGAGGRQGEKGAPGHASRPGGVRVRTCPRSAPPPAHSPLPPLDAALATLAEILVGNRTASVTAPVGTGLGTLAHTVGALAAGVRLTHLAPGQQAILPAGWGATQGVPWSMHTFSNSQATSGRTPVAPAGGGAYMPGAGLQWLRPPRFLAPDAQLARFCRGQAQGLGEAWRLQEGVIPLAQGRACPADRCAPGSAQAARARPPLYCFKKKQPHLGHHGELGLAPRDAHHREAAVLGQVHKGQGGGGAGRAGGQVRGAVVAAVAAQGELGGGAQGRGLAGADRRGLELPEVAVQRGVLLHEGHVLHIHRLVQPAPGAQRAAAGDRAWRSSSGQGKRSFMHEAQRAARWSGLARRAMDGSASGWAQLGPGARRAGGVAAGWRGWRLTHGQGGAIK